MQRNVFAQYFKVLSTFASNQTSFFDDFDLFKKLTTLNKKLNFKQFVFCFYCFVELGIFEIEKDMDLFTLIENKKVFSALNKSNFYNKVEFILKTIN